MRQNNRRIAAIVLNNLACDIVKNKRTPSANTQSSAPPPLGVIVEPNSLLGNRLLPTEEPSRKISAVDAKAFHYGLRPGQSVAEAMAFVSHIDIVSVETAEIEQALSLVAECALNFGTTAAIALKQRNSPPANHSSTNAQRPSSNYPSGAGAGPRDTVWLDVSGCSRLVGGEDLLCAELRESVKSLGYEARVAIAAGPRLAQTFARWGPSEDAIAATDTCRKLHPLPTAALPLDKELLLWFSKLGLLRISDLAQIDPSQLAPRLAQRKSQRNSETKDLLALLQGCDPMPLVPYHPPRSIRTCHSFEDPLQQLEPLLFVLRGLIARAAKRLQLRGEACSQIELQLGYDTSVVALRARSNQPHGQGSFIDNIKDTEQLRIEAPAALSREDDLLRPIRAKLENHQLQAPLRSIELRLNHLSRRPNTQLDIAQHGTPGNNNDPNALPTLLAELEAQLGAGRVGRLKLVDSLRPESRSQLGPCHHAEPARLSPDLPDHSPSPLRRLQEPTRIVSPPVPLGKISPGGIVSIPSDKGANHLFIVDHVRFSSRLERVEWWTSEPVSRDYIRARLRRSNSPAHSSHPRHTEEEFVEAWIYIDRCDGNSYLHGWFD